MHDGHAARTRQGRAVVLDVLAPLARRLRELELTTVTLDQAIAPRGTESPR